ncbi:MAG: imelysin family protein [Pseudomonadota bacterium]
MRPLLFSLCVILASPAIAQSDEDTLIDRVVNDHILSGYTALATASEALADAAQADCTPTSEPLRSAYGTAFDAWVSVSHLRFGPSEVDERGFALAFWPDPRGSTPKSLAGLIAKADPVVNDAEEFREVSVAARGFYGLEFLLYDDQFINSDNPEYRCVLIQRVASDIAVTSNAILEDWQTGYAELMLQAGENDRYRTDAEALQQVFTALSTGLEFLTDARLGRPLGTVGRPQPRRAEARRSGRSLRHVILALEATRALAAHLSGNNAEIDATFVTALDATEAVQDPVFASLENAQGRLAVIELRLAIIEIRKIVGTQLGPMLGIAAGFNSLDGD